MTPLEEVAPEDQDRAFWRYPLRQRTVVLVAGSLTHFAARPGDLLHRGPRDRPAQPGARRLRAARRASRSSARSPTAWSRTSTLTKDNALRDCRAGDPAGPAKAAGLQQGDRVTSRRRHAGRRPTATWSRPSARPARSGGDRPTSATAGRHTTTADLVATQRPALDRHRRAPARWRPSRRSASRCTQPKRDPALRPGRRRRRRGRPSSAADVKQTFAAVGAFPSKIPKLVDALGGEDARPGAPRSAWWAPAGSAARPSRLGAADHLPGAARRAERLHRRLQPVPAAAAGRRPRRDRLVRAAPLVAGARVAAARTPAGSTTTSCCR